MKKIGVGTTSFLLVTFAILWSFSFGLNRFCLGDTVSSFLGVPAWSNGNSGTHYTIFYSLIFLLPAVPISFKYENDLFDISPLAVYIVLFLSCNVLPELVNVSLYVTISLSL